MSYELIMEIIRTATIAVLVLGGVLQSVHNVVLTKKIEAVQDRLDELEREDQ